MQLMAEKVADHLTLMLTLVDFFMQKIISYKMVLLVS